MSSRKRFAVVAPILLVAVPAFGACENTPNAGLELDLNSDSGSFVLPPASDAAATPDVATAPDASEPDAAEPDASEPDASEPDAAEPDASLCGNGVVDPGETCDGNCPTSCADDLACTTDVLVGQADQCNVACEHAATGCAGGDGCCAPGCDSTNDTDCPYTVATEFAATLSVRTLGSAPGVVTRYGGLVVSKDDPNTLLIGGSANGFDGKLYAVHLQRDVDHHIVGIDGTATVVGDAPYNDGGLVYAPNGALVYTRYSSNELGFLRPGMSTVDKVVGLSALGVPSSVGGLALVPAGLPGAGTWKSISWSGGQWYELTLVDDGTGLYDVTAATSRVTLPGGPEGVAYIPAGSPLFPNPTIVVSEYSAGKVAAYTVDANGDPDIASRKELITSLPGAEGAFIDPLSGDYLFSTYGGANLILAIRGFAP